ncbi:MAG: hypothetical protein JHC87_03350 [Thermoleophilaceae bacterium]|nr:hypothetical protein [Thermoleophilaceae bacterium]
MDSQRKSPIDRERSRVPLIFLGIVVFVGIIAVIQNIGGFWSTSGDVTLHFTLVHEYWETWHPAIRGDAAIGIMDIYPPLAHMVAALVGTVVGSAFLGMSLTALFSVVLIWSSLFYLMHWLPPFQAIVAIASLVGLIWFNTRHGHVMLYGGEVIGNFFFAHLFAQALALVAIAIASYFDFIQASRFIRDCILAGAAVTASYAHTLPSVALFGFLALLIGTELLEHPRQLWLALRRAWKSIFVAMLAAYFVATSDQTATIKLYANNNGALRINHFDSTNRLLALSIVVGLIGLVYLAQWLRLSPERKRVFQAWKYLSLFGLSIAGLCVAQAILLKLGHGSEYAVKKYGFALGTALFIFMAFVAAQIAAAIRQRFFAAGKEPDFELAGYAVMTIGLIAVMTITFNQPKTANVKDVMRYERNLRLVRDAYMVKRTAKPNVAIGLDIGQPVIDTMLSETILKTPATFAMRDIMGRNAIDDPRIYENIVTSAGAKQYDAYQECTHQPVMYSIAVVDGSCLAKKRGDTHSCKGDYDFTDQGLVDGSMIQGFSAAEGHGRWTDGTMATFTCKTTKRAKPTLMVLRVRALLYPGQKSRELTLRVDGKPGTKVNVTSTQELQEIPLKLQATKNGKHTVKILIPDAKSSKEMGLSEDVRKLGVSVHDIEFR